MSWFWRRLLFAPVVVLVLVALTYLLVFAIPGDPFQGERAIDPQVRAQLRAHYGLDKPLPLQFIIYVGGLLTGDLGDSIHHKGQSVREVIARHLPTSAILGALALAIGLAVGVSLGAWAALRRSTWIDHGVLFTAVIMLSIPAFVVGPVLALVIGVELRWLPVAGWTSWMHVVLPAITLAIPFIGRIARLTRTGLQEVLDADMVRTARAKGASDARALVRHALPLGLMPVIGFMGPAVAAVLTGSLVVEKIFQVPGLGREFVESAMNRDIPLVLGTVVVYGTLVVICNLLADVVQAWVDPRVRSRT